jgi:hypothetical protein
MPFKSKAQRRKFYALKSEGKIDQKTINEWEKETPNELPEKVAMDTTEFFMGLMKEKPDVIDRLQQQDPSSVEDILTYLNKVDSKYEGEERKRYNELKDKGKRLRSIKDPSVWLGAGLGGAVGAAIPNLLSKNRPITGKNRLLSGLIGAGLGGLTDYSIGKKNKYHGMDEKVFSDHLDKTRPMTTTGFKDMFNAQLSKRAFWTGFEKKASIMSGIVENAAKGEGSIARGAKWLSNSPNVLHATEAAGLGTLAVPSAHALYTGKSKEKDEVGKDLAEVGGLGILALPTVGHWAHKVLH